MRRRVASPATTRSTRMQSLSAAVSDSADALSGIPRLWASLELRTYHDPPRARVRRRRQDRPLGPLFTTDPFHEERLMLATPRPDSSRSLIDITVGERVAVGAVLFEIVRTHCSSVGIQPGVVMRCQCCTSRSVLLQREDGMQIEIDRVFAAFVEVHSLH